MNEMEPSPLLQLDKRETISEEITRKLLSYVFAHQLGAGSRLPSERQMAESFGVGRSAIREALKSLQILGLIEMRQGDGTYLKQADSELLPRVIEWGLLLGERRTLDLVEARQCIEIELSGLAAERRNDVAMIDLRRRLDEMAQPNCDVQDFVAADIGFHLAIAEAAGNSVLSDMLKNIQSLLHVWIRRVIEIEAAGETDFSYRDHIAIFSAIEEQDPDRARAAMKLHMHTAAARLQKTLEDGRKTD